ncbi:MAG: CHAT domain-containing protein [Pyrinomonadaceae bacterium]
MANPNHQKITQMNWDELQKTLQRTTRGSAKAASDESALREYFGDDEFEELQELATRARPTRDTALGHVVILPGIMGSHLVSVENGDQNLVWVNLFRIVAGAAGRLRLTDDGESEFDKKFKVNATIVDKRTYTRAVLKLRARWNVETFAFDWRKDINAASDALAAFIEDKFFIEGKLKDKPVHLVAHSMGGLVARNLIHKKKTLWEKMRVDGQGGRLIMLGTPNYGSYTIPQVMTGAEKLVRWLAKLDLKHSLSAILEIINTFVGSYQMLPAPDKLPDETPLYRRDIWGDFPISEKHLKRARDFYEGLKDPATIDPARMIYIAGCNRQTLSGLKIGGPGEFNYTTTYDGDGRVPFALGFLDGVTNYFVEEDHGSLPKNDKVIKAVDELLERGSTSILPTQAIVTRAVFVEGSRWHRPIAEHQIGSELEDIALRAEREEKHEVTPEEQRAAEETLMRAVLGESRPARVLEELKEKKRERQAKAPDGKRTKLSIKVVKGDVRQIEAPVVVVGHYKGVTPIKAVGALDKKLNYWISQAGKQSMIGGELGQVFFIPVKHKQIGAEAVMLAGMGEEGNFSRYDLRYLMLNVTYAITALELRKFATVLIGSGTGNLDEDSALRGLLFGVCDALHRLIEEQRLKQKNMAEKSDVTQRDGSVRSPLNQLVIVERDPARYSSILKKLEAVKNEDSATKLDITITHEELPTYEETEAEKALVPPPEFQSAKFGPRITIERDGDTFRLSALTESAVIPVREVEIQSFFSDGIAKHLVDSTNREEQETYGRLLNTGVIHEDFQKLFDTDKALTMILDRSTASFPWEMAGYVGPEGIRFLGTHLKLTRQFRTLLSSTPGIAPQLNESLRVLVIADPAPEPAFQLPGARAEGRAVVKLLNQIKQDYHLDIDVVDRIGDAECDPVEILGLILDGGFDVVHYAGHGYFDEKNPSHGGWVFGEKCTLSAREIFRARKVPRLVFANACFSAVVNKGEPLTAEEMNRSLAGIAEAFFERGVRNYIGAGWPVQDDLAVTFARAFYLYVLTGVKLDDKQADGAAESAQPKGRRRAASQAEEREKRPDPQSLSESLAVARNLIIHDGSTWGAYQHYGNANDPLIPPRPEDQPVKASMNGQAGKAASKKARARKGAKKRSRKAASKTVK